MIKAILAAVFLMHLYQKVYNHLYRKAGMYFWFGQLILGIIFRFVYRLSEIDKIWVRSVFVILSTHNQF